MLTTQVYFRHTVCAFRFKMKMRFRASFHVSNGSCVLCSSYIFVFISLCWNSEFFLALFYFFYSVGFCLLLTKMYVPFELYFFLVFRLKSLRVYVAVVWIELTAFVITIFVLFFSSCFSKKASLFCSILPFSFSFSFSVLSCFENSTTTTIMSSLQFNWTCEKIDKIIFLRIYTKYTKTMKNLCRNGKHSGGRINENKFKRNIKENKFENGSSNEKSIRSAIEYKKGAAAAVAAQQTPFLLCYFLIYLRCW